MRPLWCNRLEKLIVSARANWLHFSEGFNDGLELLKTTDRMKLEDIVPKRRDAPYRPRLVERHR